MERANSLTCPSCATPLKSMRGIRIGRKVPCPKCKVAFTVRAEDAATAEGGAGVNVGRFLVVALGALLYVAGGTFLAVYCFEHNAPRRDAVATTNKMVAKVDVPDEAPASPAAPPPAPKPGALSVAEERQIDNAIANGVWFLRDSQMPGGKWKGDPTVGYTALAGLTLLECGVPASDGGIQKAAAFVRREAPNVGDHYTTYQWALAILFLDRLRERTDEDLIQYLALCLIAGQEAPRGAWAYACPTLDRNATPKLLKLLRSPKKSLDDFRKAAPRGNEQAYDNSNTQFAILALWAAQRHGIPIERPIALTEKHFRTSQVAAGADPTGNNQNLGGSWRYNAQENSSAWPTMTCAGLLGLAVAHGVTKDPKLKNQKPLDDPGIKRALDMLAREIERPGEKRSQDYYFLWSLERVGVLYDLPKIGGKDWFAWGRKILLARQQANGSWRDGSYYGNSPVLDTCFALLFLKQANLAEDLTNKFRLLALLGSPEMQIVARKDP